MDKSISDVLLQARRIVVKVGSSLVTNEGRGLDEVAIGEWCRQLAVLAHGGQGQALADRREVIMVSSGAIAEGMKRLGWPKRPHEVNELQAAAAVGQMGLAQMYETKLREHGLRSAQILLTHADLADRERYLNARSTLLTLLQHRVLPGGTPDEVRAEVKRVIGTLGEGGGYMLGAVHTVMNDVPAENVLAMVDAVEAFGRYPLRG